MKKQSKVIKVIIQNNWQLYTMLALPLAFLIIFAYYPMYGAQIAFKKYSVAKGIWGSEWVGLFHFRQFVNSRMFSKVLYNTVILSLYSLLAGFPFPIILALSLNYVKINSFKKSVQMISYAPNFISTVVMAGIIFQLFNPLYGVIGRLLSQIVGAPVDIFLKEGSFRHVYVWSGIWQGTGFGSIIYISILSTISRELHEAAIIDGATIIRRIWHIDLPGIMPTAIIMLIMSTGDILNTGFEKVLLYQNNFNISVSEVIDTYAYKVGLASQLPDLSYGAAIGLFKSIVGFILLAIVNKIAQEFSETSLW